jgi:hypothetical protein
LGPLSTLRGHAHGTMPFQVATHLGTELTIGWRVVGYETGTPDILQAGALTLIHLVSQVDVMFSANVYLGWPRGLAS